MDPRDSPVGTLVCKHKNRKVTVHINWQSMVECSECEVNVMCDVKKYSDIYREISKLNTQDTLQLVLESESEDEKDFYEMIGDYLLQKKQREVLERKAN